VTPGFDVVPETWVNAGRGVTDASDTLGRGVEDFCAAAGGDPFGGDDLGRGLFEGDAGGPGFVQRRDGLLADLPAAVNLLREIGGGLVETAGRYGHADVTMADRLGGRTAVAPPAPMGGVEPFRLPPVAGGTPATTPPPAWWRSALWFLEMAGVGAQWPDGDVHEVRWRRDVATELARAIDLTTAQVRGIAGRVTRNNEGDAAEAFDSGIRQVYGEDGPLADLARRCRELAAYCDSAARAIVKARWECAAAALFVLTLMAAVSALGPLADAWLAAALRLVRLQGLVLRIVKRAILEAVVGAAFSGGLDSIDQLFRGGRFDLHELRGALAEGALAGGMMGAAHASLPVLLRRGPALAGLADLMESPGWKGVLSRLATGGTVATTGIATAGAVMGHGWDWKHAAETGFGIALIGAGAETGTHLRGLVRSRLSPRDGGVSLAAGRTEPLATALNAVHDGGPHRAVAPAARSRIGESLAELTLIQHGRTRFSRLASDRADADALALGRMDRIVDPGGQAPELLDGLPRSLRLGGLEDVTRVFREAETQGFAPGEAAGRDALVAALRAHENADPYLWRGLRVVGEGRVYLVGVHDVTPAFFRALGRMDEVGGGPAWFSEQVGLSADEYDVAAVAHLVTQAEAHGHPAAAATGLDELRSVLSRYREQDPASWDRTVIATRLALDHRDDSVMGPLLRISKIIGETDGEPRFMRDPLRTLSGAVDRSHSVRVLARLFAHAEEHGLDPGGAGDRTALVRVLRGHRDADPRLWDGVELADLLGADRVSDATARTLSRLTGRLQPLDGRASRTHAAFQDVADRLGLATTGDLVRLIDDAQTRGHRPARATGPDSLVRVLGRFADTDPTWTGARLQQRYELDPSAGTTAHTLGELIKVTGPARSPYLAVDPLRRVADDLGLSSVEHLVRLVEGARAAGFDPAMATDRTTLVQALRHYQEPVAPGEAVRPEPVPDAEAAVAEREAHRRTALDHANAELAAARAELAAPGRLTWRDSPAGLPHERIASLEARIHAWDRWPSRPEVSYLSDYDAFARDYLDALARAERGEPVIPYMTRDVMPFSDRRFGLELEFDNLKDPEGVLQSVARAFHEAGLSMDSLVYGRHASRNHGYRDTEDGWRLEREDDVAGEAVSPKNRDTERTWAAVKKACEIIVSHGGYAGPATGGHIHVEAGDFDHIVANHNGLLAYVGKNLDTLFRLSHDPASPRHRGTAYCRPNESLGTDYQSIEDARSGNDSHNVAVNLGSLWGTAADHVEFRTPDGSLDPAVIQTRTKLMVAMTEKVFRDAGHFTPLRDDEHDVLGGHAAAYPAGLPGPRESLTFRRLMDDIYYRAVDKAQATALFAVTRWSTG
jgi:hypothetical protein